MRLHLLSLLAESPNIRTTVARSFDDTSSLADADALITDTCDLRPTEQQQAQLRDFVAEGGRWIALYATNALLDFDPNGERALDCQITGRYFVRYA